MRHTLIPHPDTPTRAVRQVQVALKRPNPNTFHLTYLLACDHDSIVAPREVRPARADGLWQRTCFEAFIRPRDGAGYFEFNFSPSTEWAAYRFTAYREGMANLDLPQAPVIETTANTFHGYALSVELHHNLAAAPWNVALSAVIEDAYGAKSYWALAHPKGKPDFHHADGFALELN
jgi:hypothetical protein